MEEFQKLWEQIKAKLQIILDEDVYNETFAGITSVFKIVNNYVYLVAPNSFIKGKSNRST